MSIIAVDLISIEVTSKGVVLHLQDSRGQHHTKTLAFVTFNTMARLIVGGQVERGLVGLGMKPDGVGDRLVTELDNGANANMGASRSHGPACHLAMILHPRNAEGLKLRRAAIEMQPLTIKNRFLG